MNSRRIKYYFYCAISTMFHLFSVLQTAILFSICLAKCLKIDMKEVNHLNKTIMLNNVTGFTKTNKFSKDDINTRLSKSPKSFIHRRLNNKDVKNNLDRFSMARRYGNPFSNFEFVPFSTYESVPYSHYESVPSSRKRRMNSYENLETNGGLSSEFVRKYENEQIFNVLSRQAVLMKKLVEVMEMEHYALRSKYDFENLLNDIDSTKKTTAETKTSTTVQVKKKLSTVMTVVDETEVRAALKKDPLVMRILKMANLKRVQYMKAAKKYYNT